MNLIPFLQPSHLETVSTCVCQCEVKLKVEVKCQQTHVNPCELAKKLKSINNGNSRIVDDVPAIDETCGTQQ